MGCWLAATKGRAGERYILANEKCMSIRDTTKIAQELFPELRIDLPRSIPKPMLFGIAWMRGLTSRITGTAPKLTVKDVAMFSGLQQDFDINKAGTELGFAPKPAVESVKEAMLYLKANAHRFDIRFPRSMNTLAGYA